MALCPFGGVEKHTASDPDRTGSHFALWRESVLRPEIERISCLLVASRTDPRICPTTRAACENGPLGCYHHCTSLAQRRGAFWLCSQRSSGHLSRIDPLATATDRRNRALQK